jgi:glycosyltransferase involved in cell wall biosynthesis
MKILWLLPSLPYPPDSGGRQDQFYLIRDFSHAGDDIHACVIFHGENPPDVPDGFGELVSGITFVPGNPKALASQLFASLADDVPFKFRKYYSPEAVKIITGILSSEKYDVVIVGQTHLAPVAMECRENARKSGKKIPPFILRTHNVESKIVQKYADRIDKPLIATFAKRESRKMKAYESSVLAEFDLVAAISPVDKNTFDEMSGGKAKIKVVTTGANIEELQPSEIEPVPGEVVFVGSFDWYPNVDGAIWLIQKVWPKVIEKFPSAHLTLVGRKPPKELQAMGSDTIKLTGLVDSVREYIDRASVCVVPLWIGSGMRLKILEAFALKRAVVSTTLGAEGIEYEEGKNIVIRDKAGEFADAVVALLENPARCREIAAS